MALVREVGGHVRFAAAGFVAAGRPPRTVRWVIGALVGVFALVGAVVVGATSPALARPSVGPGDLDPTYGFAGIASMAGTSTATAVAEIPNTTDAMVVGYTGTGGEVGGGWRISRLLPDGAVDSSFGGGTVDLFSSGQAEAVAVVPPGSPHGGDTVVGGYEFAAGCPTGEVELVVAEFTSSGTLETNFGTDGDGEAVVPPETCTAFGAVTGLAVDSAGDIVVGGTLSPVSSPAGEMFWASLNATGSTDSGPFFPGGTAAAVSQGLALTLVPSGASYDVVVGGSSEGDAGHNVATLAEWSATGAPVAGFGPSGVVQTDATGEGGAVQGLASGPGGIIVAAGWASRDVNDAPAPEAQVQAFQAGDGAVDSSFGGGDILFSPVASGSQVEAVTYDPTRGLYTLAGYGGGAGSESIIAAQFTSSGAFNTSFGDDGGWGVLDVPSPATALGVAVQSADGKPILVGNDSVSRGQTESAVVRLLGPTAEFGYWLVGADGGVFSFGSPFEGSAGGIPLNAPIVGMAATPDGDGYWMAGSDGGIFAYGTAGAHFYGSLGGVPLNAPIVGMAAAPDGDGYWLVGSDGGVFAFGPSAGYYGSMGGVPLNAPIVGIAAAPDGNGYWLVASDGGIFSFGSAGYHGSMGGSHLNAPIVGMAAAPDGNGYWLVASDGGIFSFGSASFLGSMGGTHLNAPIVAMAVDPATGGYWLVGSDGGIFNFGARYLGSLGGTHLNAPVVGIATP